MMASLSFTLGLLTREGGILAARNLINGGLTSPSILTAFAVFAVLAALALFIRSVREAVA